MTTKKTTKKTSFKKSASKVVAGGGDPGQSAPVVNNTAVATVPPSDLCLPHSDNLPAIGGLQGDFAEEDFRLPRINIVQAVGPLSEDFEPGSIVYNKDLILLDPGSDPKVWSDPLNVTVLNAKKQFQENLDYGVEEMPETVDTLDEVQERGGWIDWRGDEKPPWRPMLTVLLLIEAPSDALAEEFSIQGIDGKAYELALWTLKGSAYSRAGKAINTAARFALRNKETGQPELHKGKWTLQVRREKLGTNLVYVPRLRQHGKHPDEFVEFVTTLL
ncbi:hypothetical protein [Pontiella sulfatireligans]|uniref:Uncharacterized protein n=1 Tax=Pontiella sulfatireligans TaxID=2750658 RepID=A0A6C2UG52_9BACT|nr:hypothetical protein [Pontiella sulfatireligans]VGO19145.1 hypothetical protein SCARR_01202 [Pontiella sulfatireligans]